MNFLRQATSVDVGIGPFLDSGDGNTVENSLTITQPDVRLKKNGGNWAQKAAAQTLSHEENGWYEVTLDTTDTDTCGILIVAIHESGALPVWREFQVIEEAIYDAFFAASANAFAGAAGSTTLTALATGSITAAVVATGAIDADAIADNAIDSGALANGAITAAKFGAGAIDATAIANGAIDAATFAAGAIDAAAVADGAIDAATFAAGAINAAAIADGAIDAATFAAGAVDAAALAADAGVEIAAAVWDRAQASHVGAGTFGEIATEIASILDDTGTAGVLISDGSGAGQLDLSSGKVLIQGTKDQLDDLQDISAAQVNAEVVDALAVDTYAEPTGVPAATTTLAGKIGRIYQALRNKLTVTSSKMQFCDDAEAALWEKDLADDGTTYSESEGNAP